MTSTNLSAAQLRRAATIKERIERLESDLNKLLGSSGAANGSAAAAKPSGRRTLSASARRKIAAAQRRRWARIRKAKAGGGA